MVNMLMFWVWVNWWIDGSLLLGWSVCVLIVCWKLFMIWVIRGMGELGVSWNMVMGEFSLYRLVYWYGVVLFVGNCICCCLRVGFRVWVFVFFIGICYVF